MGKGNSSMGELESFFKGDRNDGGGVLARSLQVGKESDVHRHRGERKKNGREGKII